MNPNLEIEDPFFQLGHLRLGANIGFPDIFFCFLGSRIEDSASLTADQLAMMDYGKGVWFDHSIVFGILQMPELT